MIETAVVCLNIKVVNSNSLILSYRLCINDVDKFIFAYSYHILNLTVTSQSSKNLTLFPASQAVFGVFFARGVLPYRSHIGMCRPIG